MAEKNVDPVIKKVLTEENQGHETRKKIFARLEEELGRPVVTFFTSFKYPVMIEDADADMLEGILQKTDLSNGMALLISSSGGLGIAAERIINICRNYSGTGEYWAIVPSKAKSAATMICFGASKIIMSGTSELGPIGPQLTVSEEGTVKRFSLRNIVESYNDLFRKAIEEEGNIQPYLQQLANYDEREIREFQSAISLSEDIAVKTLGSGMMEGLSESKIKIFLKPEKTKPHGQPIYAEEASTCNLTIDLKDTRGNLWGMVYELYIRTDNFVSKRAAKCIETKENSFMASPP